MKAFYAFISVWIGEGQKCIYLSVWKNNVFHNFLNVSCEHPGLSSMLMGPSWTQKG